MTTGLVWPRSALSVAFPDIEAPYGGPTRPRHPGEFSFSFPKVSSLGEVFQWRRSSLKPTRPLLLDLYCGAGGAAMGYYRAGYDVIGVDIAPQRNYPFPMFIGDALEFLEANWWMMRPDSRGSGVDSFDAIHASPPCQFYSSMSNCRPGLANTYPDLIPPTRALLDEVARVPWVIENVEGSPLISPIRLCGFSFGYELYRHRLFESSVPLAPKMHLPHTKPGSRAGHWTPGTVISVSGHCAPMSEARKQMDIGWSNREELAESVPPFYTEYIGKQLLEHSRQSWLGYSSIGRTAGHSGEEAV